MIAPFTDYQVVTLNVSNSNPASITLDRRAFVSVGRFRRDDTGGIEVKCTYVDTIQDSDPTTIYLMAYREQNKPLTETEFGGSNQVTVPSLGSHVFEAGRTIVADAPDDAAVDLHIFYLPTSP